MLTIYEKAIHQELGAGIESELKKNHCKIIVNYDNLTYTFSNCPDLLLKKIKEMKKSKGKGSILNEFSPN